MNVGQVSLIRSRCVCFPKARAFASSDVGACLWEAYDAWDQHPVVFSNMFLMQI